MFRLTQVFCHGSNLTNYLKNSCRSLYSLNSLGVDGFVDKRQQVKQFFANDGEKFREKMIDFVENDQNSMIFTEDLKNMVHLADPVDNDIQLLEKMLRKFNKQSKEIRFGNFIFGPVVMRFFYHSKKPDEALKLFKDPEFEGFFDQMISYQILADLLYNEGRYQEVIDVFQMIRSRQIQGGMYPKHVVLLVFAACYKQNTAESFKFASNLWSELNSIGYVPLRRTITLAAALAIRQNAPHVALEIAGTARQQHYVTVRNIKVLAFTNLGRCDDALPILKSVIQLNDTTVKQTFNKDVIANLKDAVNKTANSKLVDEFNRLERYLKENGHIRDETLEDLLTSEINSVPPPYDSRKDKSVLAASYNNNNRNDRNQNFGVKRAQYGGRSTRPGLEDMY